MTTLKVLVAEDDAMIGGLLAEILTRMGHDVCAVELTAAGAASAEARCRPDLMIVDVQLGNGNGVDAVAEIDRARSVPHVFVKGNVSEMQRLQPDALLMWKPYREADPAWVIQRACDASAAA